jgi:hypothetical protein
MTMIWRRTLASIILGVYAVLHGNAATWEVDTWFRVCSGVYSLGYLGAAAALWARLFWARWYVQGIGLAGLLNCLGLAALAPLVPHTGWEAASVAIQAGAFVALLASMAGRRMSEAYDLRPSRFNHWDLTSLHVRALRWALVLSVAALPMVLRYAGTDAPWIGPGARAMAALVTVALAASIVLVLLQRSLGLLLLLVSGLGVIWLAQDAASALGAVDVQDPCLAQHRLRWLLAETAMIGAAVIPGALMALTAFAVFLRPMIRFLRR